MTDFWCVCTFPPLGLQKFKQNSRDSNRKAKRRSWMQRTQPCRLLHSVFKCNYKHLGCLLHKQERNLKSRDQTKETQVWLLYNAGIKFVPGPFNFDVYLNINGTENEQVRRVCADRWMENNGKLRTSGGWTRWDKMYGAK